MSCRVAVCLLLGAVGSVLPSYSAEALEHRLQIALEPESGMLRVEDEIDLGSLATGQEPEFLLNAALEIVDSRPAVERIPLGEVEGFFGINGSSGRSPFWCAIGTSSSKVTPASTSVTRLRRLVWITLFMPERSTITAPAAALRQAPWWGAEELTGRSGVLCARAHCTVRTRESASRILTTPAGAEPSGSWYSRIAASSQLTLAAPRSCCRLCSAS